MKNALPLLLLALFTGSFLCAQVKIGENPQNINPASVLELESSDKVLVITRVTTAQMNAITPSQGALCYNTDLQAVHFYDGTQWVNLNSATDNTEHVFTTEPIVNEEKNTIVITRTNQGYNFEIAKGGINSSNIDFIHGSVIQQGSIDGRSFQNESITKNKLSENSVGTAAIDKNEVKLSFFDNDAGYVTLSEDEGNVLITRTDGIYYNNKPLVDQISENTQAISLDEDQSATNELQNLNFDVNTNILRLSTPKTTGNQVDLSSLVGSEGSDDQKLDKPTLDNNNVLTLGIEDGNTTTVDLSALVGSEGSDNQELTQPTLNNANILSLGIEGGNTTTVDLSPLVADGSETKIEDSATITVAGTGTTADPYKFTATGGGTGGGTTELVDGITLEGTGTENDRFRIKPSATPDQFLKTTADGVVWSDLPPGNSGGNTTTPNLTEVLTKGNDGGDLQIKNIAAPTEDKDAATKAYVDTAVTAGGNLEDGKILIGDADGKPQATALMGDVTLTNTGVLTIKNDAVTTDKIKDANVTNEKIAPGDANQILRTDADGNTVAWVDLPNGGAVVSDATLSGDGSSATTPLGLADDAVTTAKIANASILAEDLNAMGATTTGEYLAWDTDLNGGVGGWKVAAANNTGGNTTTPTLTQVLTKDNDGGEKQIKNIAAPTEDKDAATKAYVDTAVTAGGELNNNQILIGDADNKPQATAITGDVTLTNTGVLTIKNDAVTTDKIKDANVTNQKIAADAITADKIANASILAEDLSAMGASTTGEYLAWDTDLNGGVGGWKVVAADTNGSGEANTTSSKGTGVSIVLSKDDKDLPFKSLKEGTTNTISITDDTANNEIAFDIKGAAVHTTDQMLITNTDGDVEWTPLTAHTGTANSIFFADSDGKPTTVDDNDDNNTTSKKDNGGFFWDSSQRFNTGALYIGLKLNDNSDQNGGPSKIEANRNGNSKLIVAERLPFFGPGVGGLALPLQLRNETDDPDTATGILFNVNFQANPGKGALVFQRGTTESAGSFHLLINNVNDATAPTITDKSFTVKSNKDIVLYGGIDINGLGTGDDGQILTSTGTGVKWAAASGKNFVSDNLTMTADRAHNLNNNTLTFGGSGTVAIGNFDNITGNSTPAVSTDKLDVNGQIRARSGFAASPGTANTPSYGFYTNGDTDTGMFRAGEDKLAFSTNSIEALRIAENQNVGIGLVDPLEKLHVVGNIRADGSFISATNTIQPVPDYVFETYFNGYSKLNANYKFPSLAELEAFLKKNHHLPGILSAKEVEEAGEWNLTASSFNNLEKIEELYLHTIQQQKEIKTLKEDNKALVEEIDLLKKDIELIKSLLIKKQ